MEHNNAAFGIPDIRSFIPEKLKPLIMLVFFFVYQLSGGVYLAAVSEMKGSMSLLQEDIMMAGYASLIGLALTFTIMFRLKFRFSLKNSLLITSAGLIVCNLISISTRSLPLLVCACFAAGIFRMWGTFACNTTIQLWVTPKRDMALWFCYIGLVVQSFIEINGLCAVYIASLGKWENMHVFVIGLILCMMLVTMLIFKHYRSMNKVPLFGIDWLGMILWAVTLLSITFVLNYGEHYDWFDSRYIRIAAVVASVSLVLNLQRARRMEHPYISLKTWTYKNMKITIALYLIVDILLSPSHFFEHLYVEEVLGYDSLHVISLNWMTLAGIVTAALCCYYLFARRRWTYRVMTLIGFSFVSAYLLTMYFIIDFNLPKEMLLWPLWLRSTGYVMLAIPLLTALTNIAFEHFPQALSVQAFFSTTLAGLLGNTVLTLLFKHTFAKNLINLSTCIDRVNPISTQANIGQLLQPWQQQAMMVSMKEIYGWLAMASLASILFMLFMQSSLRPSGFHPKFSTIRRAVRHQLRMDKAREL